MGPLRQAIHSLSATTGRWIVLAAILAQAAIALAYGVPGHLSVDSVIQLYEGRTHHFISFHPPMMSLLLGAMDMAVPGTALFVLLSQLLYTASLLLLLRHFGQGVGVVGGVLAALVLLNPVVIAYTGIVWKDVLFAHLALFGYVLLAIGARAQRRAALIAWLAGSLIALALAASLRQQGLLVALPAIVYGAIKCANGRLARSAFAVLALAGVLGVNAAIIALAKHVAVGKEPPRAEIGLRGLFYFDLAGIVAHGGRLADPAADQAVRAIASTYDPYRIDTLAPPAADAAITHASARQLARLWLRSVISEPLAYLHHRAEHFGRLIGFGAPERCLPVHVGVIDRLVHPDRQRGLVAELRLSTGVDARAQRLYDELMPYFTSPLFRHWFWALLTVAATTGLVWWQRHPALALLGASALVFAASYAIVSLACDFRYVYLLPVTATALLFALAISGARVPARKCRD